MFDFGFIDDPLIASGSSGGIGGGTALVRSGGYRYRRSITLPAVGEDMPGIVIPINIPGKSLVRFRDESGNILRQDKRQVGLFFVRVNLTTETQTLTAYYD